MWLKKTKQKKHFKKNRCSLAVITNKPPAQPVVEVFKVVLTPFMSFDTNILVKPKTGYMDSNLQMLSYWLINTNLAERENKILIRGANSSGVKKVTN